jgi:hypothetical protein
MAKTLTAANSVILLAVTGLFPVPQRMQGFSADNVFDTEQVEGAEVSMGVDGRLSGGWVPKEIKQNITLQADSDSIRFFEDWYNAQQTARELYYAVGSIYLPSLERKYACKKGILTSHNVTPSAQKIMQPRKFMITWESVTSGGL